MHLGAFCTTLRGCRPFIFFDEWVIQFGGHIFWPWIVFRHGLVGARNRLFTWRWSSQAFSDLIHSAVIVLFAVFYGTPGFSYTIVEFIMLELLFALRAAIIAGKYAH